jgi:acyl-coenzyme A synthetase/AMP-(fatty) acid ligase
MKLPPNGMAPTLRAALASTPERSPRLVLSPAASVCPERLVGGTSLTCRRSELAGRSVLLASRDQLSTMIALIELDGIARRLIICTPDLEPRQLEGVAARAEADAVVCDDDSRSVPNISLRVGCRAASLAPLDAPPADALRTEWVLLTSGTTDAPKLVVHTFESLSSPTTTAAPPSGRTVWGTFYDIRRYGGLQVLLRALLGDGSLVLGGPGESAADYLTRLIAAGATHVTGTPSHWRRALMNRSARMLAPAYLRLSGEIVDQSILGSLHSAYPAARISHAFASTEAGVAFDVDDGLEGFPQTLVAQSRDVDLRVVDGTIRIRSSRCAVRYLGTDVPLTNDVGFVDTGDVVERRGDRYHFLGRRSGVINVGGQKVYPEEVEAAINRHPAVRMSRVTPRKNPILGSLVAADIVLDANSARHSSSGEMQAQILQTCREHLRRHQVPSTIRFVPALEMGAAGKLARHA